MIVMRNTMQARYGMADQLVALTKEMLGTLRLDPRVSGIRLVTDLTGDAFTVELEYQIKSLADFEQIHAELTRGADFGRWFARIQPLVEHSRREFFTIRT